jgi:hypothetical protein
MSFNLIRNARVFFTTNVDANTGVVADSGMTNANTFELQVLDGLSYSQNTTSETVVINEAGATPVRGQRSFNTALDPVDFSFSTYMRPADGGTNITAEESVLWNALLATDAIGGSSPAWSEAAGLATAVATNSQTHQLQKFGLIIIVDSASYIIDNCALDSAAVDFGLDAIAQIAWTGKGTVLRQLDVTANTAVPVAFQGGKSEVQNMTINATAGTFTFTWDGQGPTATIAFDATAAAFQTAIETLSNVTPGDVVVTGGPGNSGGTTPYVLTWRAGLGDVAEPTLDGALLTGGGASATPSTVTAGGDLGTAKEKNTTAPYIANKLSTLAITEGIGATGTAYTIALTGGNLTISNNLTYLTPANLGIVNQPITYFTGARSVSGSLTAYLRTGALNSAGLLSDMLAASASSVDPDYDVVIAVGGSASATKVEFDMPAAVLTIPTISTEQVVSTTINFTGQGFTGSAFDITQPNEVEIRYYTTNA